MSKTRTSSIRLPNKIADKKLISDKFFRSRNLSLPNRETQIKQLRNVYKKLFKTNVVSSRYAHRRPKHSRNSAFKSSHKKPLTDQSKTSISNINSSSGPKYFITADILGQDIKFLLDSGSQVNIIPANLCQNILTKLAPASQSLQGYNDSPIDVVGLFETDVLISGLQAARQTFYVVSGDFLPILGSPFMKKADLNFADMKLTIDGQSAQIISSDDNKINATNMNIHHSNTPIPKRVCLYAIHRCLVPPNSEAIIPVRTKAKLSSEKLFATIPASCYIKNIVIAHSAAFLSQIDPVCNLRLLNPTDEAVLIPAEAIVAKAHQVQAVSQVRSKPSKKSDVLAALRIETNNADFKAKILALVEKYIDVFATDDEPLNQTSEVEFNIDTGNSPPVAQQKYRTPYFLRDEMKRIIDHNVKTGLMSPISSPWAAPVLLVAKPNGSWRLVCDYRRLNAVTTADNYPLPEIGDLVNNLSKSTIFSSTDLFSGFHQIRCSDDAKEKLAVTTEFGQFSWNVMPMGAKNCPSVFQRLMDKAFRKMPASSLCIYLDDLLIHSSSETDHLHNLQEMFETTKQHGLQLKASKTVLGASKIQFCGYVIENGTKYANPEKVDAVRRLKPPRTKKECQKVFGLLNYHRVFIKNFSKIAAPLTRAYSGKSNFKWTTEANNAFLKLKDLICNATLALKIPDTRNADYVLETDASNDGFGAALLYCTKSPKHSKHDHTCLHPVEYMSTQFTTPQKSYYIQEKEMLAGKEAMRKWACYLLGRHFEWHTDNSCFRWASRVRSSKPRISQWLAEISEFDFKTNIKRSSAMKITDCLSRAVNSIHIDNAELANLQQNDPIISEVQRYHLNNRWPHHVSERVKFFADRREHLEFGQDHEIFLRTDEGARLLAPEGLKPDILDTHHNKAGHPGITQTIENISKVYIWPKMQDEISYFVRTCDACQRGKPNLRPRIPPLGLSHTPNVPYEMLAFDLIGPLPITSNENKYILVGIDLFSKKIYTAAIPGKFSFRIRNEIERMIFINSVLPRIILTDNGKEFSDITELCQTIGAQHNKSAAYHPQTNGCVERANQSLKHKLFIGRSEEDWDERLLHATHCLNSAKNSSTKYSPFEIETGMHGRNPHDSLAPIQQNQNPREIRRQVHENLKNEKDKRVAKAEQASFIPYNLGELVLVRNNVTKHPRFLGPYEVISSRSGGKSYELRHVQRQTDITRHASQLKPYHDREISIRTENSTNKTEEPRKDEPQTQESNFMLSIPPEIEEILEDWDIVHNKNNQTASQEPMTQQKPLLQSDNLREDHEPVESDSSDTQSYHSAQSLSSAEVEEINEPASPKKPIYVPGGPIYYARVHELTAEYLNKAAEVYQIELSGSRQDNINRIEAKLNSIDQCTRSRDGKPLIPANIFIKRRLPLSEYRHFQLKQLATQLGLSKTNSKHMKAEIKHESKKNLLNAIRKHLSSLETISQTDPIIINLPSGKISPEQAE